MENIEKAIIASTLINTIFQEYKAGELNSSGEVVRKKIAKYLRQRSKSNKQIMINVIYQVDKAWRSAINHFAKENMRIEAKTTIMSIYNYFNNELEKYAGLKDKHIEKFMIQSTDDAEAERNSDIVVDYIVNELGIEKRESLFKLKDIK